MLQVEHRKEEVEVEVDRRVFVDRAAIFLPHKGLVFEGIFLLQVDQAHDHPLVEVVAGAAEFFGHADVIQHHNLLGGVNGLLYFEDVGLQRMLDELQGIEDHGGQNR